MSREYTTVQGDMWDSVAFSQCGGVECMGQLMWLNRQHLGYYIFPAGVALALPEPGPEGPGGLPPWRQVAG